MSIDARVRWRRAVRFALCVFVVLSFLPVWPAWYFGEWEATGDLASFWTMLASLPRALEQRSASRVLLKWYGPSLIAPAVVLGVSLFVGRWWAGRSQRTTVPLGPRSARLVALGLFILAVALLAAFGR